MISLYQGAVIMYGALLVFDADFIHVVSISFSALIVTELIMVAMTVHTCGIGQCFLLRRSRWDCTLSLWWCSISTSTVSSCYPGSSSRRRRRSLLCRACLCMSSRLFVASSRRPAMPSMGVILMLGCYLVAFSPSLALFVRFVAPDPLRTILCVMGAFLWLVSLLVSSLAWLVISLITPSLAVTVGFSIVMQEAARVFYFWMLKKAQHGLNKITRPGSASVAPGVSDLHNARHMLALVCGLGMGVMAALFLTMNVFAEFAGAGTVGLPKALETGSRPANIGSEFLPLYYALTASMLTLFNVTWTIMVWDSCHHVGKHKVWPVPAVVALITHAAVSSLSSLNAEGKQVIVLVCQLVILLINIIYCQYIMGGTIVTMGKGGLDALVDWLTLAWIRARMTKLHNEYVVEELERRRDNTVST